MTVQLELLRIETYEISDGPQRGYMAQAVVSIEAGDAREQTISRGQSCYKSDTAVTDLKEWLLGMGWTKNEIDNVPVIDLDE